MTTEFTPAHRGGSGEPIVLVHGFTDTWRTWELVLDALQRDHEVLAPTLPGHAGGPPLPAPMSDVALADAVERAMDEAGFATAHLVGNSLGGAIALQLAARGRARSVVALAPAGGWAPDDPVADDRLRHFVLVHDLLQHAAPRADEIVATAEGRARATAYTVAHHEHLAPELIAHMMRGAAECAATLPWVEFARSHRWELDADRITCPVRVVWGTADRILPWPSAAVRHRVQWLPDADWVLLDGVGHCIQLDVPDRVVELVRSLIG